MLSCHFVMTQFMTKILVIVICHKYQRIRVEYKKIERKTIVYFVCFFIVALSNNL